MHYVSTRGGGGPRSFKSVVLSGLADDGGLFLPEQYPALDRNELKDLDFHELGAAIMAPFTDGDLTQQDLSALLKKAWADFPAPLRRLKEGLYLLELFHGPTLAFKDFGLQFLSCLFGEFSKGDDKPLTVIGATSGDTGAAAVHALAGKKGVRLFMLHPQGRISELQRWQMTTVQAPNIFNIAIDGAFDDCQALAKALLADNDMARRHRFTTVNSINWGRLLAQSVYYWWAALKPDRPARFIVPSGNFGNAFSGYLAARCGAPIESVMIATNKNDILARALTSGVYAPAAAAPSLSPAMDIQEASNFERLLFEETGRDADAVSALIHEGRENGQYTIPEKVLTAMRKCFAAATVSDEQTLAAIRDAERDYGIVLDPHTAVGLAALMKQKKEPEGPVVLLATAHPGKFPETIIHAIGNTPSLPPRLSCLMEREEGYIRMGVDIGGLKDLINKEAIDGSQGYTAR